MKKTQTQRRSLLAKCRQGKRHLGFTLIELLATLTIMAIMAAILFPFIGNYIEKARKSSMTRSLRLVQDALDRYRAVDEDWSVADWKGTYTIESTSTVYRAYCPTNNAQSILDCLLGITKPTVQTLQMPASGINYDNVKFVVQGDPNGANTDNVSWQIIAFRKSTTDDKQGDGVTRKSEWLLHGTNSTSWGGWPSDGAAIDTQF